MKRITQEERRALLESALRRGRLLHVLVETAWLVSSLEQALQASDVAVRIGAFTERWIVTTPFPVRNHWVFENHEPGI